MFYPVLTRKEKGSWLTYSVFQCLSGMPRTALSTSYLDHNYLLRVSLKDITFPLTFSFRCPQNEEWIHCNSWIAFTKCNTRKRKIHIKPHRKIDHTFLLESFEQLHYVVPLFKNSCKKRHWSGLVSTLSINTAYQVL